MKFEDTLKSKTDQLNFDDLQIGGSFVAKITKVTLKPTDQPMSIFYEGDNGKPWKPCKSMRYVLWALWGMDEQKFVGRSVRLYPEPSILWGGVKVGGIRLSHLSDIKGDCTVIITIAKAKKIPYDVKLLRLDEDKEASAVKWVEDKKKELEGVATEQDLVDFKTKNEKVISSIKKYKTASDLLDEALKLAELKFNEKGKSE